jgi:uncharacterized membrane protein
MGAGVLHFVKTNNYLKIMPPYIPWHRPLVLLSGFFEMLGGAALLVPAIRRAAAWGLVALLIAVFPANLYMAAHPVEAGAAGVPAALLWLRLPLQLLLVGWILWCSKAHSAQSMIRGGSHDETDHSIHL